jgi:hypothetical protein
MARGKRGAAFLALLVGGALCSDAGAVELSSASYKILGSNLNGGGHSVMVSTAPSPAIGSLGSSVGQSEALGFSGSSVTLRTIAPGFWPIVNGGFPTLDADADVVAAYRDNCPFAFNPTQADNGSILSVVEDGIGDACQCADVNDDGLVDHDDYDAYRDSLADPVGFALTPEGVAKCSVIDSPGPCEILDVSVIARALEPTPLLPGIDQVCAAAMPP